jgi:DNA-binding transcriptional LysR family regulator
MRRPTYTLRQLEYFAVVADEGTVTGAAARLHLSQSALSSALADLERALGVQLLVRHHARGVSLTPAGQRLLTASRDVLRQADDLVELAHELDEDLTGSLMLGCFAIVAPYVLPPLLAAFGERLPGLSVTTVEEGQDALADGLAAGRLELGVGYDLGLGDGIVRERLFSVEPHLVLPPGHRFAGRSRVRLSDLGNDPMVLLDLPHSRDYFARLFADDGARPNVRYRTHSAELARALVARGLAYTVLNLRPAIDRSLEGLPYTTVPVATKGRAAASLDVALLRAAGVRPTRRAVAVSRICHEVLTGT